MSAKHKYWTELEPTKHQFFKIMTGNFRDKLRIPEKFVKNFKEKLSNTIVLRGPSGHVWAVELTRGDDWLFQNGWENFVQDHGLEEADLLVFRHNGNSSFKVTIFNKTACEREGAYFIEQHTSSCAKYGCAVQNVEEDSCGEDGIRMDQVEEDTWKGKREVERGNRNTKGAVIHEVPHQMKGFTNRESEIIETSGSLVEGASTESEDGGESLWEGDSEESEDEVGSLEGGDSAESEGNKHYGGKQKQVTHEAQTVFQVAQERKLREGNYSIVMTSNRRKVTEEEIQRAEALATAHKSNRPSITVVMKPTHVYKCFFVSVGKKWTKKHMPAASRNLEIQMRVPPCEKTWPIRWRQSGGKTGFGRGWYKFVVDNGLEEQDVCIFELKHGGKTSEKTVIFDVIIFRVVDNIVPKTCSILKRQLKQ